MRLLHETTSLCRECKNAVPAQVVAAADDSVWMNKACAEHGEQNIQIGNDVAWYERTRATEPRPIPPQHIKKEIDHGCPFDCGPCESHQQKVRLPVVTITSACNLDCPICYVHNKNADAFHMGIEDFKKIVGHLVADHGRELDIVNFTGGEPTLHPHFLEFLEISKNAGIHRSTICTNGLRFVREPELLARVAELGGRVALSFDSFEDDADYEMQGAAILEKKLKCLELLEEYNVDTTLIPVMTKGVNDHEIGRIIEMAMGMRCVRHMEIHTITFTGQGGTTFDRSTRISMFEVLQAIEAQTGGLLTPDDYVSSPCAHPLCYQIAYMLIDPDGGRPIPFTKFMSRETIYDALADRLYLEPNPKLDLALRNAIDELWTQDHDPEAQRALRILRKLLDDMATGDAMRAGELACKAVYIHSHMDEETWDNERIVQCCDSNCYADGTTIPVCSYNVLYREKEAHFMLEPKRWGERAGGQTSFPIQIGRRT